MLVKDRLGFTSSAVMVMFSLFVTGCSELNNTPRITAIKGYDALVVGEQATIVIEVEDDDKLDKLNVVLDGPNSFLEVGSPIKQQKSDDVIEFAFPVKPLSELTKSSIRVTVTDAYTSSSRSQAISIRHRPPSIVAVSPDGPMELTLGETSNLLVKVRHFETTADRVSLFIEDPNGTIEVVGSQADEPDENTLVVQFTLRGKNVADKTDLIINYGADSLQQSRYEVSIAVPRFFPEDGSTFVEMIDAPDDSIYGSHITVWQTPALQLVTGHAASNICKTISGALFNYAVSASVIDDDFMLGAGIASLPKDERRLAFALQTIRELDAFPMTSLNLRLALMLGRTKDLKMLVSALKEPFEDEEGLEENMKLYEQLAEVDRLSDTQALQLKRLVELPDQLLNIVKMSSQQEIAPLAEEFSTLDPAERKDFVNKLDQVVSFLESSSLLVENYKSIAADYGLLKTRTNSMSSSQATIVQLAINDYRASNGDSGTVALSKLLPNEWTAVGGLMLLPYTLTHSGENLVFDLPKSLFDSKTGTNARRLMSESVLSEMRRNLEVAAERMAELRQEAVSSLERLAAAVRIFSTTEFSAWLQKKIKKRYAEMDERGRPTGKVTTRWLTNKEFWLERVNTAEDARIEELYYRKSAEDIQRRTTNSDYAAILEYTLLDSFLRGWDLVFVDNSLSSPYKNWINERRPAVWHAIIEQAQQKRVDPLVLFNENTVFQVRADGDSFRVIPLFIANISDTDVVWSNQKGLIYYESRWSRRKPVYLRPSDLRTDVWEAAVSNFSPDKPEPGLEVIAEEIEKGTTDKETLKERRDRLRRALTVYPEFVAKRFVQSLWDSWEEPAAESRAHEKFRNVTWKAASYQDDMALERMINSGEWPFVDHYADIALNVQAAIDELTVELEKAKTQLAEAKKSSGIPQGAVGAGSGTTGNSIARWALDNLRRLEHKLSLFKEYFTSISRFGREIDKTYFDEAMSNREIRARSDDFQRYITWVVNETLVSSVDIARCLSSLSFKIELDEIDEQTLRMKVDTCFDDLNRLRSNGLLSVVMSEKQITDVTQAEEELKTTQWDFDALGKAIAEQQISDFIGTMLTPVVSAAQNRYEQNPSKRLLNSLVQLTWYTGHFKQSFDMMLKELRTHSKSQRTEALVSLGESLEPELMKALIYSGGQLHVSAFGRRASDWVRTPDTIDKIPVEFRFEEGTVTRAESQVSSHGTTLLVESGGVMGRGPNLDASNGAPREDFVVWLPDEQVLMVSGGGSRFYLDPGMSVAGDVPRAYWTPAEFTVAQVSHTLKDGGWRLVQVEQEPSFSGKSLFLSTKDRLEIYMDKRKLIFDRDLDGPPASEIIAGKFGDVYEQWSSPQERDVVSRIAASDKSVEQAGATVGKMNDVNVITYEKDADKVHAIVEAPDGIELVSLVGPDKVVRHKGDAAIDQMDAVTRRLVEKNSSDVQAFAHLGSFKKGEGGSAVIQVGGESREITRDELDRFISRQGDSEVLDALFGSSGGSVPRDVIFYRSAFQRGSDTDRQIAAAGGGGNKGGATDDTVLMAGDPDPKRGGEVDARQSGKGGSGNGSGLNREIMSPLTLVVALSKRYKNRRFFLDDEMEKARENLASLPAVKGSNDIAAYLTTGDEFKVEDRGAVKDIERQLKWMGVQIRYDTQTFEQGNVMVISGHKDEALVDYLEAHRKAGNFKDKIVVLFSCYQNRDESLNHKIIKEGGARGVLFYSEKINPIAVRETMIELGKLLNIQDFSEQQMSELLDRSVQNAKSRAPGALKREIEKMGNGVLQLSRQVIEDNVWENAA